MFVGLLTHIFSDAVSFTVAKETSSSQIPPRFIFKLFQANFRKIVWFT